MKKTMPFLISSGFVFASAMAHAGLNNDVCQVRKSSLDYILNKQIQTDNQDYKAGEWTSQIKMGGFPRSLTILKKGPFEDANAFTLSSVQNILAEIYLEFDKDPRIPSALTKARHALKRYRMNNGGYNFWPKNPKAGVDGHLPVSDLTSSIFDGLVTIPADADDTSLVYLSVMLNDKILGPDQNEPHNLPEDPSKIFSTYTDHFRVGLPAGFFQKKAVWSGAYLTWLKRGPVIPLVSSAFFPQSAGPRVVLGLNVVDCVVNANVLRTLALFDKKDAKGFQGTCNYLTSMAKKQNYNSCGVYYPNTYWLHFTAARAYQDGATCLKEAVDLNLAHLLKSQQADGRWKNELLDEDDMFSTALATNALLKTGDPKNLDHIRAAERAIDFLVSGAKKDSADSDIHWKGGAFFSGGILVRKQVLWTSDAYTTALVTQVLFEAGKWFPRELTCSN